MATGIPSVPSSLVLISYHSAASLFSGACKLKVIDVNDQEQVKLSMPVTTPPSWDRRKLAGNQVFIAMFLPISPRVRVTIE